MAVAHVGAARAQSAPPPSGPPPSPAAIDDMLKTMRADMQSTRSDIMAKNMTLTAEQAAKFWPVFDTCQKEQNVTMDAQLKDVQRYVAGYETLDDATALALINAHLDRDAKMNALRTKWLAEFQKVLPARLAARTMQIDRRLSLLAQLEISSKDSAGPLRRRPSLN